MTRFRFLLLHLASSTTIQAACLTVCLSALLAPALAADSPSKTTNPNVAEWRQKADAGDPEAAHLLGHALLTGDGIPEDPKEAVRYIQTAADRGHAMAQLTLGLLLDEGGPIPADKTKAFEYYKKAADQNLKEAQYNLGMSYATGEGVAKNLEEAAKWYQKAAENWDPNAQLQLGLAFLGGKGVKQSREEAAKWLRRSAYQANADAQFQLGILVHGENTPESKEEAVKWLERAVENSHVDAMAFLGGLYARGDGVEKKTSKALEYLGNAAKQGHPRAEYELGLCFLNGEGVHPNDAQAFYWLQLAARHGDPDAQLQTASLLARGRGVPADKDLAAKWLRVAAAHGNNAALVALKLLQPNTETNRLSLSPSEAMPPMVLIPDATNLTSTSSQVPDTQPAPSEARTAKPNVVSPPPPFSEAPIQTASSNPAPAPTRDISHTPAAPTTNSFGSRTLFLVVALTPVVILSLILLILWSSLKHRLHVLETEVRETKAQLRQANENMSALLKIVETKMLAARPAPPFTPIAPGNATSKTQIRETSGETSTFKVQRPPRSQNPPPPSSPA